MPKPSMAPMCILGALAFAACATAQATTPVDAPKVSVPAKPSEPFALDLMGAAAQGGMMVGRTVPLAKVFLGDMVLQADASGLFVIGFDRDAGPATSLRVIAPSGAVIDRILNIETRTYKQTRVDGLPPAMVTPPPEVLARIKADAERKGKGFASIAAGTGFTEPFLWPIAGRISSPWGAQRVLNGELDRPHYGVDIAAPIGTPISAPADGVIAFAESDLYYEGGLVMIDHGQGLITLYLHMSELDVAPGQKVKQGQVIGRVGNKGRTTGPHLCWRMKWRGQNLDPSLAVAAFGGPAAPLPLTQ
ncbi:MAG: M23 family metallopeptidase [Caulobacterales bacterium]